MRQDQDSILVDLARTLSVVCRLDIGELFGQALPIQVVFVGPGRMVYKSEGHMHFLETVVLANGSHCLVVLIALVETQVVLLIH